VNAGIGLPTMVADFIPADRDIVLHSENGILGVAPAPGASEIDWDLINAGWMHSGLFAGAEWIRTLSSALDRQWFRGFVRVGAIYLRVGHPSPPRPRRTDGVVGRRSEKRYSPPESSGVTTDRAVDAARASLRLDQRFEPAFL